jgi:hypothetical protein
MIQHVVMFRWRADAPADAIAQATRQLAKLSDIDGVTGFACGGNFAKSHEMYPFVLTLRLSDKAALKAYWPHPLHTEVLAAVKPVVDDVFIADFEI